MKKQAIGASMVSDSHVAINITAMEYQFVNKFKIQTKIFQNITSSISPSLFRGCCQPLKS